MNNKTWLIINSVLVVIILIISIAVHTRNHKIGILEYENIRLKESKNELSFEFEKINLRRLRRDSLVKAQNKSDDEQIKALNAANDSTVKRVVTGLIAE